MNLKIKNTTGLILTNNILSGNTYPVKDYIKKFLDGKWDKNLEAWIINPEKVHEILRAGGLLHVDETSVVINANAHNGKCPRCGTYCYGDCATH